MPTDNGGPAFPRPVSNTSVEYPAQQGMELLDWFAGQALAGLLANSELDGDFNGFATDSYRYAESMIAEKRRRDA